MSHGLPEPLNKLFSLARMKRTIEKQITTAVQSALEAGYSPDRITEILITNDYPPPGVSQKWLRGWEAARDGATLPDGELETYDGFQSYLTRNS